MDVDYLQAARAISKKRYEAAKKLEKIVEAEINGLAMKSQFRIEVSGTDTEENWTESGFDQIPLERRAKAFAANEGGWTMVVTLIEKYLAKNS